MFFVKNTTTQEIARWKAKATGCLQDVRVFWNKIIRVVACMFVYEDKRGGGNRYLLTTIHKNRPLYISVPLRLLSWCSNTKLFVRKGERNEWWHASTPAQGGVGPSFGGACHACSHWIQSMYIFLYKMNKKVYMVSGFSILSKLLEMMNLFKHVDKNIYGFRN